MKNGAFLKFWTKSWVELKRFVGHSLALLLIKSFVKRYRSKLTRLSDWKMKVEAELEVLSKSVSWMEALKKRIVTLSFTLLLKDGLGLRLGS